MKLSNKDLIEEFYEFKTQTDPDFDLSIEQLQEICHAPWKYLKREMELGTLNEVRFKYFGVFRVLPGRAKNMLKNLKERFDKQQIEPCKYFKYKQMIDKFLENEEKKV